MAEIFSPPRTCRRAQARGLRGGWSLDVVAKCGLTGKTYDLLQESDQQRAKMMVQRDKPALLVASPPCTALSVMQNLNQPVKGEVMRNAIRMVDFAVEMCMLQYKAGRKFVFEHPSTSRAWRLPSLMKLAELNGMCAVDFDQCMFGQTAVGKDGVRGLAKKRTRVMTNSEIIDKLLDRQCSRDHEHVPLTGGRAAKAAAYPTAMCDAFLDGILMETEQRDSSLFVMDGMCDDAEIEGMTGIDDVSGEQLEPEKIMAARQQEMDGV